MSLVKVREDEVDLVLNSTTDISSVEMPSIYIKDKASLFKPTKGTKVTTQTIAKPVEKVNC